VNELDAVLAAWKECCRHGRPAVLATVVKVTGSAYRRPGARMLFPSGAPPAGVISGGCLEGDLAERIGAVLESGEARVQVYDMRSPDDIVWGLGLGCNGEIRVLLERLSPEPKPELPEFLAGCREARRPGVVATVFEATGESAPAPGSRLLLDLDGTRSGSLPENELGALVLEDARDCLRKGRSEVRRHEVGPVAAELFVEYLAPPVRLLVFGAGSDSRPLVRLAKEIGWEVGVLDNRAGYATPELFPEADQVSVVDFEKLESAGLSFDERTPVVVMTHHFLHDLKLLAFLLPRPLCYLGLLGPRQRAEKLLHELGGRGVRPAPDQFLKLHGPVGLDIGAETSEEIALSVVAEIQTVLAGRRGGFLKNRSEPLHDWPS
jgi:xanthine/CO dehydrogenase XdhC/CoxF family maturation factor